MSYEIMYDRRFIKMSDNRYIPLILSGSNNCTQINYATGREVLERNWNVFWGAKDIITTKEQMMDWAKYCIENHSPEYEVEWFKQGSKWVTGKQIFKWIENGCKNAYTIEEYLSLARTSLKCEIVLYTSSKESYSSTWERKERKYIKTEQELVDWIEMFKAYDKGSADEKYYSISFAQDKPLKLEKPTNKSVLENPYMIMMGKKYLVNYNTIHSSVTYSPDKTQAEIFTDASEFDIIVKHCASLGRSCKAIPAVIKEKPFYIVVSKGYRAGNIVKKKAKNSLHFAYDVEQAIHFETEKQAQKYIETLMGRFESCEAFDIVKAD